MTGMTVVRWAKYGKERLYVTTALGERVGWYDVRSGRSTLEMSHLEEEFLAAVAAHLGTSSGVEGGARTPPAASGAAPVPGSIELDLSTLPPPNVDVPPAPAWSDLAENRPGQAAREQADAHLARMKEKSRIGTFLARTFDVKTDERSWRVGADGEETVGAKLEKLTAHGWHVLHAVPVGERGSDIDHVLIGPAGVYTVNTKTHLGKRIWVSPNQIRVDGHVQPYLRNSRHEADRARRLLGAALGWEPPVRPVLVFLTGTLIPQVDITSGGPDDVEILDRMTIPRAFRRAARKLSDEAVAEVYDVARRSTTWRATPRGG